MFTGRASRWQSNSAEVRELIYTLLVSYEGLGVERGTWGGISTSIREEMIFELINSSPYSLKF